MYEPVEQIDPEKGADQAVVIATTEGVGQLLKQLSNLTKLIKSAFGAPSEALASLAQSSSKLRNAAKSEIPTIVDRLPINSKYAGGTHPAGVKFNKQGFPNFGSHSVADVKLEGLTGDIRIDSKLANEAMGYPKTPKGYTWHHVEDGRTMQLVPSDIHKAVRHTGGASVILNGGFD